MQEFSSSFRERIQNTIQISNPGCRSDYGAEPEQQQNSMFLQDGEQLFVN